MTVQDAIVQLGKLPPTAIIGSYNPVCAETIYLERFELQDDFVQILFEEEPKSGHPFAAL